MNYDLLLLSIIFVPLAGSLFVPLIGYFSKKLRNFLSLFFILASFLFSLCLLKPILSGNTVTIFILTADCLAVFMAIVSSLISAIIILYSFDYISHYENQNEYYSMVVLFCGSMMGLCFSGNLILLYIFWEITAITSWRLIGFYRERDYVLRADKSFLVTVFGALLMLLGFILIYKETGSIDLTALKGKSISTTAVLLVLAGIFSKSATLPFHTWLPDAGVAPSPVTALLHAAVLVKIGVYAFARLFLATFALNQTWYIIVPVIAGASALVSAGAALVETDIKRIIAYSTISQIGFIFLGFSAGNEFGIAGALLYILMHGIAKAGMFLCAGIVEQNTKTKDITKLGGLINTMPLTAVAFLFCAFSVMGIPPFGGFFSKYLVFGGAIKNGEFFIALLFLLGACLTILYLLRLFNMVFLGDTKIPAKEGSATMVACVIVFAVLSLISGILINFPSGLAQLTTQQILGLIK